MSSKTFVVVVVLVIVSAWISGFTMRMVLEPSKTCYEHVVGSDNVQRVTCL